MLKSLGFWELKSYCRWLNERLSGAQLQATTTNDQALLLTFYKYETFGLLLSLASNAPLMLVTGSAFTIPKKTKPVGLFLNSHAKNLRWDEMTVIDELGRVVELVLTGGERNVIVLIQLIPKAPNIIVTVDDGKTQKNSKTRKSIAWEKPKEAASHQQPEEISVEMDWAEWCEETLRALFMPNEKNRKKIDVDPRLKVIQKKQKALLTLREQLEQPIAEEQREFGRTLQAEGKFELAEEAFQKAKDSLRKRSGTLERVAILEKELKDLNKNLREEAFVPSLQETSSVKKQKSLMEKSEAKGRRLDLGAGVEAWIGKSAKDNLALLRKAQAWDLWLHLKDYPGAHAIISHPRNTHVGQREIQKTAEWVIRESLKNENLGGKYEVVVVECRFVRPIKGDKLGRVTYHSARSFMFSS